MTTHHRLRPLITGAIIVLVALAVPLGSVGQAAPLLQATNTPTPTLTPTVNPSATPGSVGACVDNTTPWGGYGCTYAINGNTSDFAAVQTATYDLGAAYRLAAIDIYTGPGNPWSEYTTSFAIYTSADNLSFEYQADLATPARNTRYTAGNFRNPDRNWRYVRLVGLTRVDGWAYAEAVFHVLPAGTDPVSEFVDCTDIQGSGCDNGRDLLYTNSSALEQGAIYDLGSVRAIEAVTIHTGNGNPGYPNEYTTSFNVYSSTDGVAYDLWGLLSTPDKLTAYTLAAPPSTQARYVKVLGVTRVDGWAFAEVVPGVSLIPPLTPIVLREGNYLSDPTFSSDPFSLSPWQSNWWTGNVRRSSGPGLAFDARLGGISGGPCDLYYWHLDLIQSLSGGQASQSFDWPGGTAYISVTSATTDTETFGRVWLEDDEGEVFNVWDSLSFPGQWNTSYRSRFLDEDTYTLNMETTATSVTGGKFLVGSIGVWEYDYGRECPTWEYGNMTSGFQVPAQTATAQALLTATALGTPVATPTAKGYLTATAQASATATATSAWGSHTNQFGNCGFEKGEAGWILEGNTRLISPGGATGPTYALIDSSSAPGIWAPFTWAGGPIYVTYWVGPYSRINTQIRANYGFGSTYRMDSDHNTASEPDWVKRFWAFVLPAGSYIFEATNSVGGGYKASLDGLAITIDGYSTAGTTCGNADSSGSLATQFAATQTAAPSATARAQATATSEARAGLTATAQAAPTGTARAAATMTAAATMGVTPTPTNTQVVTSGDLTAAASALAATQTQSAVIWQTSAANYTATASARGTATARAQATQTTGAQITSIAQTAVATAYMPATPDATSIVLTAQAPYHATATAQAWLTATAQGTVVATPQPWPTPQTDYVPLLSWFQWTPANTQQLTDFWLSACEREPMGTICEFRDAMTELGQVWDQADWAQTGFEGEATEEPSLLVFIHAAPDILSGEFEWTDGPAYDTTCELSITWMLGDYLTIPICFLFNILTSLGLLAWIQWFWDAVMMWGLFQYLRWAYIGKASNA